MSIIFGSMIANVVTPQYISISPKRKLRNNIDVTDYFAGDNEIYE